MLYNKLLINVIVRIILISLTCFFTIGAYYRGIDTLTIVNLVLFLLLQIFLFIRNTNRMNRDLANFFTAIKNEDSTLAFTRDPQTKSFQKLYESLDEVNNIIREIKIENVNQNQYFHNVVEHVGVGLIVFDEKGEVELFNNAAKKLLKLPYLYNIGKLDSTHKNFSKILMKLRSYDQKLVRIFINEKIIQLSVKAIEFKISGKPKKLVSLQNIKSELDEKEVDSWQKLISILRHEIMNSTVPITATIKIIADFFKKKGTDLPRPVKEIDEEVIRHTIRGLGIIEERSEGLVEFVEKYRSLTNIPEPQFTKVPVSEMIQGICFLMEDKITEAGIILNNNVKASDIKINADKNQVEQVLINLFNNSINALQKIKNKTIELDVYIDEEEKVVMRITDNGPGIPKEDIDKIFIPFFTTEPEGSGIGLSLSRQIMKLHGGTISVNSIPGEKTEFELRF